MGVCIRVSLAMCVCECWFQIFLRDLVYVVVCFECFTSSLPFSLLVSFYLRKYFVEFFQHFLYECVIEFFLVLFLRFFSIPLVHLRTCVP